MKSLLAVVYDYPPCAAPGAALRSAKLARYLGEYGWRVFVLCRDEGGAGAQAGEPSGAGVRRVGAPLPEGLSYQLAAWTWAGRILAHGRAAIREVRPDLIYSSGPPFAPALAALRLAREARIPAVVDLRDAWSLDPFPGGNPCRRVLKRGLCRWVYPGLERRIFENAGSIVVNTPSMQRAYASLYESAASRIHLVTNGFDEADFSGSVEPPSRRRPLLLYCGRFTGITGRSPGVLLRAMRLALDSGVDADLEILGDDSVELRDSILRFGLGGWVTARAAVSHEEAIRAMREADILVLYQGPGRSAVTPIAGKTFEYLRTGRPILAIVPPGDNAELVRSQSSRHELVTSGDPAQAASAIRRLVERPAGAGQREAAAHDLSGYSRAGIAARMAAIFNELTGVTN